MRDKRWLQLILLLIIASTLPEAAYFLGYLASDSISPAGKCTVVALGFPDREDGSPHPVQRYRVAAAVHAFSLGRCETLILTGGVTRPTHAAEAEVMARLAIDQGVPEKALVLEKRSMNTRQNILYSLGHLENMDEIILVSDPLHVHRGRRYLCELRASLCPRTRLYTEYRPLELYSMKAIGAPYELAAWVRDIAWR